MNPPESVPPGMEGTGGDLASATLRGHGVREMFTLSGGHVFPL